MNSRRHPDWLKVRLPAGENYNKIRFLLDEERTHTVCQEAKCPNSAECWGRGTATFLILGDTCTRYCGYCNVKTGKPTCLDLEEPKRVARIVNKLGLRYAVITSVTRDDLSFGGAGVFAEAINEIRKLSPDCKVEVLTPDFRFKQDSIKTIINAEPDVFAHNMEVVKNLFPTLRPGGNYDLSLNFLKKIKELNPEQKTKSGIMVGFGEKKEDIADVMRDLRLAKCDIFTIGQYLQPTDNHHPIVRYYTPSEFKELEDFGYRLGFKFVKAGPLVRSSYYAEEGIK
ncbi:lipoyl synthase [Candidatus Woesearchaeota archaeon]|nr:lipoyl synthase [Candidatus Woesearchaeota archaeon]